MAFVIWIILLVAGFRTVALSWRPFAVMVPIIAVLTVFYNDQTIDAAARLGEDQSLRWHPLVFAIDILVTFALWSVTYLVGFAFGWWWRRRKRQ